MMRPWFMTGGVLLAMVGAGALLASGGCEIGPGETEDVDAGVDSGTLPLTCDGRNDCDACKTCAALGTTGQGPCFTVLARCEANPTCVSMSACRNDCNLFCLPTDVVCLSDCRAMCEAANPEGSVDYVMAANCVICTQCANDCAGGFECVAPG
jgi:hypothetical protein